MAQVYGAPATDFFFGLLNNTLMTTVAYASPQPALPSRRRRRGGTAQLRRPAQAAQLRRRARRRHLSRPERRVGADTALRDALAALSTQNHQAVDPFFATYPELLSLYITYISSAEPLRSGAISC